MIKPTEGMTLRRFARLLGYHRVNDREFKRICRILENRKMIKIQQSGFLAHSMAHPKLVCILKPVELDWWKKRVLRVNFRIDDYTVHQTTKKRRCDRCRETISYGQRYGSKVEIGRRRTFSKKRIIHHFSILCLPCLISEFGVEDL